MKLFDIVANNDIDFKANVLGVPPFSTIWERDKSKSRSRARQEIKYVVFLCDTTIDNPYRVYADEDERRKHIIKDHIKDDKWKPDKLILEAVEKFKAFQETPQLKLLRAAQITAEGLHKYFSGKGDIKSDEEAGKTLDNMGKLKKAIETLTELENQLMQQQAESTARGGGEIGEFENPIEINRDDS